MTRLRLSFEAQRSSSKVYVSYGSAPLESSAVVCAPFDPENHRPLSMESFDSSRVPSALSAASFPLVFWVCGQAEDSVVRIPFASVMAMWLSPVVLEVILNGTFARPVISSPWTLLKAISPRFTCSRTVGASSLGSTKVVTRSVVVLDVIC